MAEATMATENFYEELKNCNMCIRENLSQIELVRMSGLIERALQIDEQFAQDIIKHPLVYKLRLPQYADETGKLWQLLFYCKFEPALAKIRDQIAFGLRKLQHFARSTLYETAAFFVYPESGEPKMTLLETVKLQKMLMNGNWQFDSELAEYLKQIDPIGRFAKAVKAIISGNMVQPAAVETVKQLAQDAFAYLVNVLRFDVLKRDEMIAPEVYSKWIQSEMDALSDRFEEYQEAICKFWSFSANYNRREDASIAQTLFYKCIFESIICYNMAAGLVKQKKTKKEGSKSHAGTSKPFIRILGGKFLDISFQPELEVKLLLFDQAAELKHNTDYSNEGVYFDKTCLPDKDFANVTHSKAVSSDPNFRTYHFEDLRVEDTEISQNTSYRNPFEDKRKHVSDLRYAIVFKVGIRIGKTKQSVTRCIVSRPLAIFCNPKQQHSAYFHLFWDGFAPRDALSSISHESVLPEAFAEAFCLLWMQLLTSLGTDETAPCPLSPISLLFIVDSLSVTDTRVNQAIIHWPRTVDKTLGKDIKVGRACEWYREDFSKQFAYRSGTSFQQYISDATSMILANSKSTEFHMFKALDQFYCRGLIIGPLSREKAEALLQRERLPVMMLRFSGTTTQQIIITFSNGVDPVCLDTHLSFDKRAAEQKCLTKWIHSQTQLQKIGLIYPNHDVRELPTDDSPTLANLNWAYRVTNGQQMQTGHSFHHGNYGGIQLPSKQYGIFSFDDTVHAFSYRIERMPSTACDNLDIPCIPSISTLSVARSPGNYQTQSSTYDSMMQFPMQYESQQRPPTTIFANKPNGLVNVGFGVEDTSLPADLQDIPMADLQSLVSPQSVASTCSTTSPFSPTSFWTLSAVLKRAYKELIKHQIASLKVDVADKSFQLWNLTFVGPDDTAYADGEFLGQMAIPDDFPTSSPQIKFSTQMYHPNIDAQGQVDLPLLRGEYGMRDHDLASVLQALVDLLLTPRLDICVVNENAAAMLTSDAAQFWSAVAAIAQEQSDADVLSMAIRSTQIYDC